MGSSVSQGFWAEMTDLADLTISEAGLGLRAGDFTSVDLLEAVMKRASMTEAQLHAYLTLDHEGAASQARSADELFGGDEDRGPLQGIPVALKDNMCTLGVETTASSKILAGWIPPYDATVVERQKAVGDVIIG